MQKKWMKNIFTVFFLVVFLYAAGNLFFIWQEYRASEKLYQQAQAAGAQPGGFNPEDFAGAQGGYADPNAGDGYADAGYTDANFTDAN